MKAIGGYLPLELNTGKDLYPDLWDTNSGRNAFAYLLIQLKVQKLYIPYYSCSALWETAERFGIEYSFYPLFDDFTPNLSSVSLSKGEFAVVINYFGLMSMDMDSPSAENTIYDFSQSLFSKPSLGQYVFYSPRKFLGIPDGGYATKVSDNVKWDICKTSHERINHLVMRRDCSAEAGYSSFQKNEEAIGSLPLEKMSELTKSIIRNAKLKNLKEQRVENFNYLDKHLSKINTIQLRFVKDSVPLCYPFLINNGDQLRQFLSANRMYTPQYWKDVLDLPNVPDFESRVARHLVCLPIDQTLEGKEMDTILLTIQRFQNQ
jgi:hypothetical protein